MILFMMFGIFNQTKLMNVMVDKVFNEKSAYLIMVYFLSARWTALSNNWFLFDNFISDSPISTKLYM